MKEWWRRAHAALALGASLSLGLARMAGGPARVEAGRELDEIGGPDGERRDRLR